MNKRIERKKIRQRGRKILQFIKSVSPNHAIVVAELAKGILTWHGDCRLDDYHGDGRMVNSYCVGAYNCSGTRRVFVVWKDGCGFPQIAQYRGEDLFPKYQN